MSTFLFVHGTGVREAAYNQSFGQIATALEGRPRTTLARCYWGGLGARLSCNGASIPTYDTARRILEAGVELDEVGLWGLVYQDPLCELRALAARAGGRQELPPGSVPPGRALDQRGKILQPPPELATKLRQGGIDTAFPGARAAVTASNAYREALLAAPAALAEYRVAIARALIGEAAAQAEQAAGEEGALPAVRTDAALRDEIMRLLVEELGGQEYGIGGWVKKQLGGLATGIGSRVGTFYTRRRRGAVTDAAYPFPGDILLYQARGGEIRSFIRNCLLEAAPPVVVLAHSLGGIACVDLLIEEPFEGVELLVTAGSQAPFLYEIGAMQSLATGQSLPERFPRWLNLYDRRDFLSYVGEKIFPDRVRDVEVNNQQPFPESHGSYWTNPAVWNAIFGELK